MHRSIKPGRAHPHPFPLPQEREKRRPALEQESRRYRVGRRSAVIHGVQRKEIWCPQSFGFADAGPANNSRDGMRLFRSLAVAGIFLVAVTGCGRRETRVDAGIRTQTLHLVRGSEPQELDPHVVVGQTEHWILMALLEGLVSEDPVDLHPVPGVAERWDISPDGRIFTFHLRSTARWSNGERVTAQDFLQSYRRALEPAMAYQYAYMLYVVKNAEAFN